MLLVLPETIFVCVPLTTNVLEQAAREQQVVCGKQDISCFHVQVSDESRELIIPEQVLRISVIEIIVHAMRRWFICLMNEISRGNQVRTSSDLSDSALMTLISKGQFPKTAGEACRY
jgi:hypothetical protein